MKARLAIFLSGMLFAIGLGVAGMTLPSRVIGFLDIFGAWDPTLVFVMVGGIGVHAAAYRMIAHRPSPIFEAKFHIPARHAVDRKLLVGSAIFGIGWGIGGYCPGPGLVSLASFRPEPVLFVAAMVVGILTFRVLKRRFPPLG